MMSEVDDFVVIVSLSSVLREDKSLLSLKFTRMRLRGNDIMVVRGSIVLPAQTGTHAEINSKPLYAISKTLLIHPVYTRHVCAFGSADSPH
jgi:hypothetical protein